MEGRKKDTVKCLIGLVLITIIIAIPHNLFGFDLLSFFSIFSFLLWGMGLFYRILGVFYILIIVYCSLTPLLCLQFYWAKMELWPELWRIIINTNARELKESTTSHWFVFFVLSLFCGFVTFFLCKFVLLPKVNIRTALLSLTIGFLGILLTSVIKGRSAYMGSVYLGCKNLQPIQYWTSLIFELRRSYRVKKFNENRAGDSLNLKLIGGYGKDTNSVIVLVIGESSRYDHWNINGYYRNTSPYTNRIENLVSFQNMASPAGATIYSIPLLMTASDPYSNYNHYMHKGIIDAFNEGGFYSVYLTNQEESRKNNYFEEYHFQSVDSFINPDGFYEEKGQLEDRFDENLLPIFNRILGSAEKKKLFICIHLLGSHNTYKNRYPKSFDTFKPTDKNIHHNRYGYDSKIAEYDNSILYNDYVLSRIIQNLKKKKGECSLIFLSDHGEDLMDDSSKQTYHGIQPNKYLIHIPYFVWVNDKMKLEHPDYLENMEKNRALSFSSGYSTMYSLLNLAGLVPESRKKEFDENSVLSSHAINNEQRVYAPFYQNLTYSDLLKN